MRKEGGHVAKFLGDGVLVCFGWPRAHEDDAERAVRAGLGAAAAVARLETPAGPLAARVAGARRPGTGLVAYLVGWSGLAPRLDPEDLREVLLAYREAAAGAVTGQGGSLSQHQGDGLLARFGFPTAREDDAERALRAALGITGARTATAPSGGRSRCCSATSWARPLWPPGSIPRTCAR